MECLTKIYPEEEVPNINCLVSVLHGTKKDYKNTYSDIKSFLQPVKTLKYLLENI